MVDLVEKGTRDRRHSLERKKKSATFIETRDAAVDLFAMSSSFTMYVVDAFTRGGRSFTGNPAAVIAFDQPFPADSLLQSIAAQNNLPETAFVRQVGSNGRCHLRWFTPDMEIDLCGHATLATAHVLFDVLAWNEDRDSITFDSRAGPLCVQG